MHRRHCAPEAPRRRWVPIPVVDFSGALQARLRVPDARDAPAGFHAVGWLQERLTPRDAPAVPGADGHDDVQISHGPLLYERLPVDAPAAKLVGVHDVVRRHKRLLSVDATASSGVGHQVFRRQERLLPQDAPAKRSCVKHVRLSSGDAPAFDSAEAAEGADAEGACQQVQQVRLSSGDVPAVRTRSPRTERYMVRQPIVHDILMRLRAGTPTIDGFGDDKLHVWPRWWGPGSVEAEDAFTMNWSKEPLLWLNPPFTLLNAVVQKLQEDQAVAILVMPHWCNQEFYEAVKPLIVRNHF